MVLWMQCQYNNIHVFTSIAERGRRMIKMNDKFFLGYRKTSIENDEVLVSILIPFTVKV